MRLDINLASQPYEDAQRFWLIWGTATASVGLVTLILFTLTISGFVSARHDHHAIAAKRTAIAERDQLRANAEEFLNRTENRSTRDESQFLNQLIERKSFSWTQVLESLEKVMPARVHLVSINPGLDEENELRLKMMVGSDSRDHALELVRRMEDSHRFAQTSIVSEHNVQGQGGDTEEFEIEAVYIPEPPAKTEPPKTATEKRATT
jgi:type IV pilus assembly protein PilN